MYDYSVRIEKFWEQKIRLSTTFKEKLFDHRNANRDRLISRLPKHIEQISLGKSSFRPQGSMAMKTIIQTRFVDEEYDIDDGVVLQKSQLKNKDGSFLSAMEVKEHVRDALKDERFNRQPKLFTNCVRVFYADEDAEKHHVDFPVYRKYMNSNEEIVRELASAESWSASDPTQVNKWFDDEISKRNKVTAGKGSQLRKLVHLLKRFCKSRKNWDLPNGMKLTMLTTECQPGYSKRIDHVFRNLLIGLKNRLDQSLIIRNMAHPDRPKLTRSSTDENVKQLLVKVEDALEKLNILDKKDCTCSNARQTWDYIFKTDGFFMEIDELEDNEKDEDSGLVDNIPTAPVDLQGGGRFG